MTKDEGPKHAVLNLHSSFESVSTWGQDLNVRRATPTGKMSLLGVFERI